MLGNELSTIEITDTVFTKADAALLIFDARTRIKNVTFSYNALNSDLGVLSIANSLKKWDINISNCFFLYNGNLQKKLNGGAITLNVTSATELYLYWKPGRQRRSSIYTPSSPAGCVPCQATAINAVLCGAARGGGGGGSGEGEPVPGDGLAGECDGVVLV
eukprot:TRINITY_DN868_c0_g1_i16.p2 TRINITY_DN868_c0_g1~~TRINITY_DN868_c0_g1_i16.p2  ORF type:complete len:161 (-),score=32.82 TRINITY_DN868_c0_g1_i16:1301-1783(-)